MRTAQQWLDLPKDERALELGRVLVPEPWKHGELELSYQDEDQFLCCAKCGDKIYQVWEGGHAGVKRLAPKIDNCSVPDPIKTEGPEAWGVAMEWFRKAATEYPEKLTNAIVEIFLHEIDDDTGNADRMVALLEQKQLEANAIAWFMFYAQPKHYLIAAAMAAERKEE